MVKVTRGLAASSLLLLLLTVLAAPGTEAVVRKRACKKECPDGQACAFKGGRPYCVPSCQVIKCGNGDVCRDFTDGTPSKCVKCNLLCSTFGGRCGFDENGEEICIPIDVGPTCEAIRCGEGFECIDGIGVPSECVPVKPCTLQCQTFGGTCGFDENGDEICIPNDVGPTCETIRCKEGFECVDNIGLPSECVPVKPCTLQCQTFGGTCGFDENGEEICIPNNVGPTCETIRCKEGFVCQDNIGLPSECVPVATCASTTCLAPSDCIDTPEGAKCVAPGTAGDSTDNTVAGSTDNTAAGSVGNAGNVPAGCAVILCAKNTQCQAGANGEAECVPIAPAGCAAVLCAENTKCQAAANGGVECVPINNPCAAAGTCPADLKCAPINGGVQCLPPNGNTGVAGSKVCASIICPSNTKCAQEKDFATCVFAKPDQGPCANAGTCKNKDFYCMKNPSHEGVLCLPANGNTGVAGTKKCANIMCPSNTRCAQHTAYATCVPKGPKRGFL